MIARPFAEGVADVMFQGRQQIALIALQPLHVRRRHHPYQPRIFSKGLFRPSPAHIARDIQHRGQPLLAPDGSGLFANLLRRALHQRRVPGRTVVQRRREQRCIFAQQPYQTLFMKQRRNAEPGLLHHHALQAVGGTHAGFCINNVRAERAGDLPDAQLQPFAEGRLFTHAGEFIAQIAALAVVAVFIEDQPVRVHLGKFLFRRHTRQ
ncbi:Uncharacterised protein [Enterobacter hormaechei]|nr:Uncharacterised protein [Enterobacter hormaechei]